MEGKRLILHQWSLIDLSHHYWLLELLRGVYRFSQTFNCRRWDCLFWSPTKLLQALFSHDNILEPSNKELIFVRLQKKSEYHHYHATLRLNLFTNYLYLRVSHVTPGSYQPLQYGIKCLGLIFLSRFLELFYVFGHDRGPINVLFDLTRTSHGIIGSPSLIGEERQAFSEGRASMIV